MYEAARPRGIRIPEDLSVVGYDDLRIARWVGPPLTTIRQPLFEMAETAARLLIGMVEDPEASAQPAVRSGHEPGRAGVDGAADGGARVTALQPDASGSCTLLCGVGSRLGRSG